MADGKARTISANLRAFGTLALSSLLSTEHKSDNSESETFLSLSNPSKISDRSLFLSVRLDKNVCSNGEAITIRKLHNLQVVWDKNTTRVYYYVTRFLLSSYLSYLLNKLPTPMALSALGEFFLFFCFEKIPIFLPRSRTTSVKQHILYFAICLELKENVSEVDNLAFKRVYPSSIKLIGTLWLWSKFGVFKCVHDFKKWLKIE